jgi:hypothetical protein
MMVMRPALRGDAAGPRGGRGDRAGQRQRYGILFSPERMPMRPTGGGYNHPDLLFLLESDQNVDQAGVDCERSIPVQEANASFGPNAIPWSGDFGLRASVGSWDEDGP